MGKSAEAPAERSVQEFVYQVEAGNWTPANAGRAAHELGDAKHFPHGLSERWQLRPFELTDLLPGESVTTAMRLLARRFPGPAGAGSMYVPITLPPDRSENTAENAAWALGKAKLEDPALGAQIAEAERFSLQSKDEIERLPPVRYKTHMLGYTDEAGQRQFKEFPRPAYEVGNAKHFQNGFSDRWQLRPVEVSDLPPGVGMLPGERMLARVFPGAGGLYFRVHLPALNRSNTPSNIAKALRRVRRTYPRFSELVAAFEQASRGAKASGQV